MNDAWSIMDIVILVCGVYALYAAYVLKTKGEDHQDISCVQGDGCEYL